MPYFIKNLRDIDTSIEIGCSLKYSVNPIPGYSEVLLEDLPSSDCLTWLFLEGTITEFPGDNELQRQKDLKAEALAYQKSQMSTNERGIINGYSESEIQNKPMALKNREWADKIFWIYERKLANPDDPTPFSNAGDKPHTFKEILTEKRTL